MLAISSVLIKLGTEGGSHHDRAQSYNADRAQDHEQISKDFRGSCEELSGTTAALPHVLDHPVVNHLGDLKIVLLDYHHVTSSRSAKSGVF